MAKRPVEIKIADFPAGEPKPLFVAARNIGKVIIGLSPKTAANWRSQKIGPRYSVVNGSVYYAWNDLEDCFGANPVMTSGGESS